MERENDKLGVKMTLGLGEVQYCLGRLIRGSEQDYLVGVNGASDQCGAYGPPMD